MIIYIVLADEDVTEPIIDIFIYLISEKGY